AAVPAPRHLAVAPRRPEAGNRVRVRSRRCSADLTGRPRRGSTAALRPGTGTGPLRRAASVPAREYVARRPARLSSADAAAAGRRPRAGGQPRLVAAHGEPAAVA